MGEFQPRTISPSSPAPVENHSVDSGGGKEDGNMNASKAKIELDDKPISLMGTPYIVNIYAIEEYYKGNISNFREKVDIIDKYIKDAIMLKKYKAIGKNYKKVILDFEDEISLNDAMTEFDKIELMYYYLKGKLDLA